jgi:(p)ppGpp synthase/HD superfamily hydrolase
MSKETKSHMVLSDRFADALKYAIECHGDQPRKSTQIPYICHPLGVASLVIEAMGDEDQAIAGLLHDVAEDCGGEPRLIEIEEQFGERVAGIVRGCSDSLAESERSKNDWWKRKEEHLEHLAEAHYDVLLVTAADKLHNARAIATDLQSSGEVVWKRFNADQASIILYYESMLSLLHDKVPRTLINSLTSAIAIMKGE